MRTFWIITLVLVTVLVMATAASAAVRDSVASLVGAGSGDSSGDGGSTFTVTATKAGDQPDAADEESSYWAVENAPAPAGDGEGTYTFRSSDADVDPAVTEPTGDEERWSEEMAPLGPSEEPPAETPVDAETMTKKEKGKAVTE